MQPQGRREVCVYLMRSKHCNNVDLYQLPWFAIIISTAFILSQRGDMVIDPYSVKTFINIVTSFNTRKVLVLLFSSQEPFQEAFAATRERGIFNEVQVLIIIVSSLLSGCRWFCTVPKRLYQ